LQKLSGLLFLAHPVGLLITCRLWCYNVTCAYYTQAKPHLDTFAWGDKERERAFYSNVSDSVPRQARFDVHRSGIYEPAKS